LPHVISVHGNQAIQLMNVNVVQNFMAEAAAAAGGAPAQPQTGGPVADQGYNSYPAHASVYASPPSNPGHAGGYSSVYGANYGY